MVNGVYCKWGHEAPVASLKSLSIKTLQKHGEEGYLFIHYFQWKRLSATFQCSLDTKDKYDLGVMCWFEFAKVWNGFICENNKNVV